MLSQRMTCFYYYRHTVKSNTWEFMNLNTTGVLIHNYIARYGMPQILPLNVISSQKRHRGWASYITLENNVIETNRLHHRYIFISMVFRLFKFTY